MTESPVDSAQRELAEGRPGWAKSPMLLLFGLILVAAVIAAVVAGGGSDDSADTSDTSSESADVAEVASDQTADTGDTGDTSSESEASQASTGFGGPGSAEQAAVGVEGPPLALMGDGGEDPAIGQTAPVVTAASLENGDPVVLGPGRPRVVGFFAHWCPHCQAELPELVSWLGQAGLGADAEFVAVSTVVDPSRGNYPPSAWFEREGFTQTVVVDDPNNSLLGAYGFSGFPAFVAIDANGTVVDRVVGNAGVEGFERLASALSQAG